MLGHLKKKSYEKNKRLNFLKGTDIIFQEMAEYVARAEDKEEAAAREVGEVPGEGSE